MDSKMQVIVVTNRKGGVGKTTVATHVAGGLALRGYRVALVDTDAQGHSALALGLPKENGLFSIMTEQATFADVLRQVQPERYTPPGLEIESFLALLPGDRGTVMIPQEAPSPFRFRQVLDDMNDLLHLDYVIVDTGPTASMFDGAVNFAADWFLHVTECARLSFDGLKESIAAIDRINRENRRYKPTASQMLGIVPNRAEFKTSNHRVNVAALGEHFGDLVFPMIQKRTVFEVAMEYGQLVYSYAANGREMRQMEAVVNKVEERTHA